MVSCTVKVPATTANIGPGFDSVGCAFALYNTLTFTFKDSGITFSGCEEKYANKDNLAYVAFKAVFDYLGESIPGCNISFDSIDVPVSRGLGSSAALIVAGAVAANHYLDDKLSKAEILDICNNIEGHPDNLSPAIYGGLTASLISDEKPLSVCYNINKNIKFVALIPDFELLTIKARAVLPKEIPFKDAVFNSSHLAVLMKALENGDFDVISVALNDKLHQPYRKSLIDGYDTAEKYAKELGACAFCISGAGPTCLCITDNDDFAKRITDKLENEGFSWKILNLPVDYNGAVITESR